MEPSPSDREISLDEEIARNKERIQDLKKKNLQSLNTSITLAKNATQIGITTVGKLERQHEQLNNIEKNMDHTDSSVSRSSRRIRGMKSMGGWIANMCSPKPKSIVSKPTFSAETELRTSNPKDFHPFTGEPQVGSSSYQTLKGSTITPDSKKDPEEKALDELGNLLDGLQILSADMNTQLTTQSKQVDRIGERIENTNANVTRETKNIKEIA